MKINISFTIVVVVTVINCCFKTRVDLGFIYSQDTSIRNVSTGILTKIIYIYIPNTKYSFVNLIYSNLSITIKFSFCTYF